MPFFLSCGLGVRGGPPWCFPFRSFLASFVFAIFFTKIRIVTRSVDCFSFAFGTPCSRLVRCYCIAFFLLFFQQCFVLPAHGGMVKHRENRAQFQRFLFENWEELQAQHFLQTQTLVATMDQGPLVPMSPSYSSFTSPPPRPPQQLG